MGRLSDLLDAQDRLFDRIGNDWLRYMAKVEREMADMGRKDKDDKASPGVGEFDAGDAADDDVVTSAKQPLGLDSAPAIHSNTLDSSLSVAAVDFVPSQPVWSPAASAIEQAAALAKAAADECVHGQTADLARLRQLERDIRALAG